MAAADSCRTGLEFSATVGIMEDIDEVFALIGLFVKNSWIECGVLLTSARAWCLTVFLNAELFLRVLNGSDGLSQ